MPLPSTLTDTFDTALTLSSAIEAGVSTIFVGLGEDPQVLAIRAPQLFGVSLSNFMCCASDLTILPAYRIVIPTSCAWSGSSISSGSIPLTPLMTCVHYCIPVLSS